MRRTIRVPESLERGEVVTKGREVRNAAHGAFVAQGYQEDSPKDDDGHYVWDDRFYQPDVTAGYSRPAPNSPDGLYHNFCIYDDGSWYHHAYNTKRYGGGYALKGRKEGWALVGSGSGKDDLLSHLNQGHPEGE